MKQFILRKAKLLNGLGMEVTFEEETIKDGSNHIIEDTIKNPIPRHGDMDTAADELRIHVARVFKLLAEDMYGDVKSMKGDLRKRVDIILNSITITAVTYTGREDSDTLGVLISAKMETLRKKFVTLNTPNMMFNDDENYPYIHQLETDSSVFAKEVEKYIIDKKYGQASLFDEPLSIAS